jgi:hypothetical protein
MLPGKEELQGLPSKGKDELDAVCAAADKAWGKDTIVALTRECHTECSEEECQHYWRVQVSLSNMEEIDVCHTNRLVALGMAMAAIQVEGV